METTMEELLFFFVPFVTILGVIFIKAKQLREFISLAFGPLLILGGVLFILGKEAYVNETKLSEQEAVWGGIVFTILGILLIVTYFYLRHRRKSKPPD